MRYGGYDLAGNVGVAMMVGAYLLLQLGKLRINDVSYSLINALGAAFGADFVAVQLQLICLPGGIILVVD